MKAPAPRESARPRVGTVPLRPAGLATALVALAACANLSGLNNYSTGECTGVCAAGPDASYPADAPITSDAGDDSSAPGEASCAAGLTWCGSACVDEQTSTSSCGGCGPAFACAVESVCQAGVCTPARSEGGTDSGTDSGADGRSGDAACTPVTLPPSINVDVTQWAPLFPTSPTWTCSASGTTTIDSRAGTIGSTSCALSTPDFTNNVTQTTGGSAVMVVRLRGLTVTNGHVLKLQGDKPIVLLVAGDVLVDLGGKIDAGASGTTAGPGGSLPSYCTGSTGANSGSTGSGGGGGGFGTAGGYGAGPNGNNASAGGAVSSGATLQPLRGGCPGGTGAGNNNFAGGAGGGAFEISASGTITVGTGTNSALMSAAGGYSPASTANNSGSGGAGSGGGILIVSPGAASFGTGGGARAHGGGSGAGRGLGPNGVNGTDGHSADDTRASGGMAPDINGAAGVQGGLCSGSGCATATSPGANGVSSAAAGLDGSGGGGGGGRVQIVTSPATMVCN